MEITSAFGDLLRYMEWADALVWSAVLASPATASDEALRDRLYHVHDTQHGFLQVWRGVSTEAPPGGFQDAADLGRWARQFYAGLEADASLFGAGRLGEVIPASLVQAAEAGLGRGASTPTIADTVLQVVTHTVYHRGQVNMRLRELGCEPPLTEYFVWVWAGKPGASWPAATS
jgi:uncharacterized damage-inducible protein DinB